MRVEALVAFIKERHAIHNRRVQGLPKPWTEDKILQSYRFCNVYRELDTVTIWIAKHWRKPLRNDPNLWLALTVARFINWPPTLEELGWPTAIEDFWWNAFAEKFRRVVTERQACGGQVYSGAYMVRSDPGEKHEYLLRVFKSMWDTRDSITSIIEHKGATLAQLHEVLVSYRGVGSFMAGQIIADLKYVQMKKAPDWWTFAASGPGSRRGLNRVVDAPVDAIWDTEEDWHENLMILYDRVVPMLAADREFVGIGKNGAPLMHAQDLQNCLCEFDKYERVRLGEGRPRSLYPGATQ